MNICQVDRWWLLVWSAKNSFCCIVENSRPLSAWSLQQGCELKKERRVASSRLRKWCSFSLFSKGVGGARTLFQKRNICCWFWGQCQDVLQFKSLTFSCIYFGRLKGFFLKGLFILLCSSISMSLPLKKNLQNENSIVYCWSIFVLPALKSIYIAGGISGKNGVISSFSDELVFKLTNFHVC